ncbi:putative RNA-directed DNA polymerase [Medicago truncatula]|uniref:Putative RNA-directed DNA polymerase n=1 Tax=Medicago truncatula TaxID=3880 RepID=A0A396GD37_MEDTR|nr:putative RNA-directed DNA polymerase [Medicago truncatula]
MKIIWDELEDLRPTPSCVCAIPCSCKLSTSVRTYKNNEYILCFLKGLNDNYTNVRTQILLMDPLPSISKTYSLVIQQDSTPTEQPSESNVFNVNSSSTSSAQHKGNHGLGRGRGKGPKTSMLCSNCNKTNHTVENCYFKHGFPPGYRSRNQLDAMKSSFNNGGQEPKPTPHPNNNRSVDSNTADNNLPLSRTEYQYLINLLKSFKLESSTGKSITNDTSSHMVSSIAKTGKSLYHPCIWILDSGASDHVCPFIQSFTTIFKIKPILVSFPNGNLLFASYAGSIHFSENLYLDNVLFLPEFHLSIISISQLTKNLNCLLIFSSNSCMLQDTSTQRTIGDVELINNLYILNQTPKDHSFPNSVSFSVTTDDSQSATENLNNTSFPSSVNHSISSFHNNFDVWHYRLGHPSNSVLQQLCTYFPYINFNKNLICDHCHLAKQTKLSFPNSEHTSSNCFDLLHMDIWGPISSISLQGFQYFLTIVDDFSRYTWTFLMKHSSDTI